MSYTLSISIPALSLLIVCATPVPSRAQAQSTTQDEKPQHTRYVVTDIGTLPDGTFSQGFVVNQAGLTAGTSSRSDGTWGATLWYEGLMGDIGKPGLGGQNSQAYGVNEWGQAVGEAQTSEPNSEDFCGFNALGLPHSNTSCLPFLWQNGVMTQLPTLGGANGVVNMINNHGEAVGYAENKWRYKGCLVAQFLPVIWKDGKIQLLHTYPGDSNGIAAWINDKGQAVGSSGACAPFNQNSQLYLSENHALLWDDGKVIDLGNLGGSGGMAGNHACAINNRGRVVGHSDLLNDKTFHGFLWTRDTGMVDLGTLQGDSASLANDINDEDEVVGASLDSNFNPRAFLRRKGTMVDLNAVVQADSPLYLLSAFAINDVGEITGFGATSTGDLHAFLATPCDQDNLDTKWCSNDPGNEAAEETVPSASVKSPVFPESARKLVQQLVFRRR